MDFGKPKMCYIVFAITEQNMKRVDFIEILYSFLCLEKHRNFQSAAEELNVSKSTLSRRMTMLEKELGEIIFIRDSTPIGLTEHGTKFLRDALRIKKKYELLNEQTESSSASPKGTVYISAPSAIGNGLLIGWIKQFQDIYPEIIIDLTLTLGPVRILAPECDIRINHGLFPCERVLARPLGCMLRTMVASEKYLSEKGLPKTPFDLEQHHLLGGNDLIADSKLVLRSKNEVITVPYYPRLRLKDHVAARTAAICGLGISVHAFQYDTWEYVRRGQLCEVLPEWKPEPSPVSLLLPQNKTLSSASRTLADFIEERWKSHPHLTHD